MGLYSSYKSDSGYCPYLMDSIEGEVGIGLMDDAKIKANQNECPYLKHMSSIHKQSSYGYYGDCNNCPYLMDKIRNGEQSY